MVVLITIQWTATIMATRPMVSVSTYREDEEEDYTDDDRSSSSSDEGKLTTNQEDDKTTLRCLLAISCGGAGLRQTRNQSGNWTCVESLHCP